jgi:photosystem I subunit 6|tara:strand:- start:133 stop:840 length:708 start_codon:yes stop_codon:yes gene_type:complete
LRNYACIAKLNLYRRESSLGEKRDATVRFVLSCSENVIRARANVNPFFFSSLLFLLWGPKTRRFVGKGEFEARRRGALSSSLLSESGKSICLSLSSSFAMMRSPVSFRPFWCLCLTIITHLSLLFKTNRSKASTKKISAKYGDESVYFDLGDVESTTGSWDVYGVESTARYPDQQAKFFENAAQGLGRREAMYSFLALSGGAACLVFGGKGSKDAKLPITIGPQKEAVKGPRDRL